MKNKIRGLRRKKPKTYLSDVEDPRHDELHAVVEPHDFEESRRVIDLRENKVD